MVFSSITFLYVFLPIFLIVYLFTPDKYKNLCLLIFSLLFYALGEPKYIVFLLLSCIVNYFLSQKIKSANNSKPYLILGIIYNVGQLIIFKYTDFFIFNINEILNANLPFLYIVMPIGISFYTFQALGYLVDVYNKKHEPASSLLELMTYISLFPQLIAGPIVRYDTVKDELKNKDISIDNFGCGVKRFIIGLSKKVLIANTLAEFETALVVDSVLSAWLKPILFTLQIYFDFSGYSDMAIGLGLMMGFKFLENFNYPLIANSITDFWRRWHISLSSWFRDYIYIPLGGNRVSTFKWIRNILIVWGLTGFWHGASWNFILWGIYFGIILLIEKIFLQKYISKTHMMKHVYTLFIVIISFLIFKSESLAEILSSLEVMFGLSDLPLSSSISSYHLKNNVSILLISIIAAVPIKKYIKSTSKIFSILEPIFYLALLILSTAFLVDESFNPFLYFRF